MVSNPLFAELFLTHRGEAVHICVSWYHVIRNLKIPSGTGWYLRLPLTDFFIRFWANVIVQSGVFCTRGCDSQKCMCNFVIRGFYLPHARQNIYRREGTSIPDAKFDFWSRDFWPCDFRSCGYRKRKCLISHCATKSPTPTTNYWWCQFYRHRWNRQYNLSKTRQNTNGVRIFRNIKNDLIHRRVSVIMIKSIHEFLQTVYK